MHVLITGATGFVGKHVLFDALVDNRITKVTVVGRRPPSLDGKHMTQAKEAIIKKLTMITREDLTIWDYEQDNELASALADCRACIWCIGGKADDFSSPQEFERVSYTFTLNSARFLSRLAQSRPQTAQAGTEIQPFRFCYCSGKWANRTANTGSGLFSDTRNMKGRVESALLSTASQSNGALVVYIFRPGGVVSHSRTPTLTSLGGLASSIAAASLRAMPSVVINVERLAKVMVDASVGIRVQWQRQTGAGDAECRKDTWESDEIVSWSLELGV